MALLNLLHLPSSVNCLAGLFSDQNSCQGIAAVTAQNFFPNKRVKQPLGSGLSLRALQKRLSFF